MRGFTIALFVALGLGLAIPVAVPAESLAAGTDVTRITPEQAIALAVNDLEATAGGFHLRHPRYAADFTSEWVRFRPRGGDPQWRWRPASLAGAEVGPVRPANAEPAVIRYQRGVVAEEYVVRANTTEQRFVIAEPLDLGGKDLVLVGSVESTGRFEARERGWAWRSDRGEVRLGEVKVFDATGATLPASFVVTAHETRLTVLAAALAEALYPVTIDPEIGANDFRISDMGGTGDPDYDAEEPAVAYNSMDNEYLVVWSGDDYDGGLVSGEREIFGQLLAADGGGVGGNDFRISDMGGTGDYHYNAWYPAVAYNSTDNEYLVVWEGDDNSGGLVDNEKEIFGQLLDANGGGVGANDFRISDMGGTGVLGFPAEFPAVAHNSTDNEYLVVWEGDDNSGGMVDNEKEIFGQLLNADGGGVGANDFRISDAAGTGDPDYDANRPAVAYNSTNNEYLVVWNGNDDIGGLVYNEYEVFGQLLDADGGGVGANDFRISDMGGTGDPLYNAFHAAVAYNSTDNEYLVAWSGDDNADPSSDGEAEIFGQLLDADGGGVGANDFRISDMGSAGMGQYRARKPSVAHNSTGNEYLVAWEGYDDTGALVYDENEVFGQLLDADGRGVGPNDFRISDMGGTGNPDYDAVVPAVAYNAAAGEYLVVWEGDDDSGALMDEEFEIFGQRLRALTIFSDGFESGDTWRWTVTVP